MEENRRDMSVLERLDMEIASKINTAATNKTNENIRWSVLRICYSLHIRFVVFHREQSTGGGVLR